MYDVDTALVSFTLTFDAGRSHFVTSEIIRGVIHLYYPNYFTTHGRLLSLQCCLTVSVLSAPSPHSRLTVADPQFKLAADRCRTLVVKILGDIPVVHHTVHTAGLTLQPSSQMPMLQMMASSLGISTPSALMPLSAHFTLENSLSRMSAGIQLHQDLLQALAPHLVGLDDLRADLRDLHTQITKMQALGGGSSAEPYQSPDLAAHLHGDYEIQVANHLTLTQLRAFCHDIVRSMRNISTYRP
ncbi:hypothetical protein N1851_022088 [Merluccius polli]|uniref:Granulocyte colony-stimulating factor n=1 Tax=Merluccius polli TaxID=89951 RepID=A0AA47MIY1_MERPO|nr:hypothetical protein N1851_022088 [Merluccius polli]